MKTQLDERFKVANARSVDEYIDKIDLFINQYKHLRPRKRDLSFLTEYYSRVINSLVRKVGLRFLDETYFCKSKLSSSSYEYFIAYCASLDKNVIVVYCYWSGQCFILEHGCRQLSVNIVKRLYKLLVTDVVDIANVVREKKLQRDEAFNITRVKYHFGTDAKGNGRIVKLNSVQYEDNNKRFVVSYSTIGLNGINMTNSSTRTDYLMPYDIVKRWGNFVHSDDYITTIRPLMKENVENKINTILTANEEALSRF